MKRTCLLVGTLMILAALVLASYGIAAAVTCDATSCTWAVSWTEPSVDVNGAALSNLTNTTLYWQIGSGTVTSIVVPATKPAGGGAVSTKVKILVVPQSSVTWKCWTTGTNPGGTGAASATTTTGPYTNPFVPPVPANPTQPVTN